MIGIKSGITDQVKHQNILVQTSSAYIFLFNALFLVILCYIYGIRYNDDNLMLLLLTCR